MRQKTSTAPPPTAMPIIIFKSRTCPEAIEPTEFDAEIVMSGAPEEVVLLELVDSEIEDRSLLFECLGLFADHARTDSRRTLGMTRCICFQVGSADVVGSKIPFMSI